MESPESTKNNNVVPEIWAMPPWEPTTNTISQEKASTTTVRKAVASVEFTFSMPIFANTAVIPAKKAEPSAKNSHITRPPIPPCRFLSLYYILRYLLPVKRGQKILQFFLPLGRGD